MRVFVRFEPVAQPKSANYRLACMRGFVPLLGLALASFAAGAASAQDSQSYRVRAGIGAQVRPEYLGGNSYEWGPYWTLSAAKAGEPFAFGAPGDSPSISLISTDGFSFGPTGTISSGRKDSEIGAPVGKISKTVEAGAFAQYYPTESIRLRAELRQGIGGHGGLVGFVGADRIWRDGDRYSFSIGPRVHFSDARYQREFFGVTPEASVASGLPVYRPGGGIHAVGVTAGLNYSLGGDWGIFGYGRYDRLVGDARNSPIVQRFGSPNQFSAGLGITRTFTIRL